MKGMNLDLLSRQQRLAYMEANEVSVRTVRRWLRKKLKKRLARMTQEELASLRDPESQNALQDDIIFNEEGGNNERHG